MLTLSGLAATGVNTREHLLLMNLQDRVVIITGASSGIGRACVGVFRKRGARLVLNARSAGALSALGMTEDLIVAGDVTDPTVRQRLVAETVARFAKIDVLINNAGRGSYIQSWRLPEEDYRRILELNFFAPMALIQEVVPVMQQQHRGVIVNVGSVAGKMVLPWMTLYSASKFAIGALTDGMRVELKRYGIHAMTVCPGYILTQFQKNVIGDPPPAFMTQSRSMAIPPEQCAEDIARGIERETRTVYSPGYYKLFVLASRTFGGLLEARFRRMLEAAEKRRDEPEVQ